tara:strand:- start:1012 stop:1422 length:411 start_codon:yes stop_codon:yes gene_type:complete
MALRPPRDPHKVGSFSELRSHYTTLYKELDECKRMKGITNEVLKTTSDKVRGATDEAKKARGQVIALTKREHAKSKEKSAAAYATTAATTLIITYQVVEVSGGWGKWEPVFQHEATIGVLQVIIGSILAFAMRPLR